MIQLEKIYISEKAKRIPFTHGSYHLNRPSWIRINDENKRIQFIKIIIENEPFWYRRYFDDYFFPLNPESKDYKNYYDEISSKYDSYVPQNKEFTRLINSFCRNYISKNAKILDLGAGTGIISQALAKENWLTSLR